jgi:hypothetical protein
MDDLVVRWVIGRSANALDQHGREVVEPTVETALMSLDGVLRRLRQTLLEEAVLAVTVQIGEYDHVSERTREEAHGD